MQILATNWKRIPGNQPFNVKPKPNKRRNSAWKRNAK